MIVRIAAFPFSFSFAKCSSNYCEVASFINQKSSYRTILLLLNFFSMSYSGGLVGNIDKYPFCGPSVFVPTCRQLKHEEIQKNTRRIEPSPPRFSHNPRVWWRVDGTAGSGAVHLVGSPRSGGLHPLLSCSPWAWSKPWTVHIWEFKPSMKWLELSMFFADCNHGWPEVEIFTFSPNISYPVEVSFVRFLVSLPSGSKKSVPTTRLGLPRKHSPVQIPLRGHTKCTAGAINGRLPID